MEENSSGFKLNKKIVLPIIGVLVLLVGTILAVYLVQQRQVFKPKAYETKPVSGPETSFSLINVPASIKPGEVFRVSLVAKSDIDAANLFVAKLRFPQNLVSVQRIDTTTSGTFIKNWVEQNFDNVTGELNIVGGVPNPGYKTTYNINTLGENMADIWFMAKSVGSANITYAPEVAIYRNSDNSNILNIKREAVLKIAQPTIIPSVTVIPTAVISLSPSISVTPTPAGIKGDVNNNGKIELVDMSGLLTKFGESSAIIVGKADINGDGVVNSMDYSLMLTILRDNKVIK